MMKKVHWGMDAKDRFLLFLSLLFFSCFCILIGIGIDGLARMCEGLEIVDGIRWTMQDFQHSYIHVEFDNRSIAGEHLSVEFLGAGLLVSRWIRSSECYEYFYIDLREKKVIDLKEDEWPKHLRTLQKERKVIRSYCLSALIGDSKIDEAYNDFITEKEQLKRILKK